MAYTSHMGFAVPKLSTGRESFSPDASHYDGPLPSDHMNFVEGPPIFAVEVRSKNNHGGAEVAMVAKRADYFLAGPRVVWDVDPRAGGVRIDHPDAPDQPVMFSRGQWADAKPALPGRRMAVDEIFG